MGSFRTPCNDRLGYGALASALLFASGWSNAALAQLTPPTRGADTRTGEPTPGGAPPTGSGPESSSEPRPPTPPESSLPAPTPSESRSAEASAPQAPAPVHTATEDVRPAGGATPAAANWTKDVAALTEEVRSLRLRVDAIHAPPTPARAAAPGADTFWPWLTAADGVNIGGYLQTQYEAHQDSQDQLSQGGAALNKDRFTLRRARLSVVGDWKYAAFAFELDANTTSGPQVDLRKAEASLQYRPDRSRPPIVMATVGQFDTPFGYELVESPRTRWFLERSVLSRAFWPGEPDVGFRLAGALGFFRWTIAPINGEPLGESSSFSLQDPNAAKDVVFRFGFDAAPRDDLRIGGDVSAIRGKGFHAGTAATNSGVQWIDLNGDGVIQASELQPIIGRAASASLAYDRWAVGADLRAHFRSGLGVTKLYAEFVAAANMDRSLFVADPVSTGVDQRELGFYVGLVQELGPYAAVGFRYDFYDPNADAFDRRRGLLLPYSQAITTYSPLVGLQLPDRARLLFQYDFVQNSLARSVTGVPTNLPSKAWTARLQVQL